MRLQNVAADLFREVSSIYWKIGGVFVVAFVVYAIYCRPFVFPVDDAYITLHNAVVLRGAPDLNYAGVPALVGATSIVHTVFVALLTFVLPPTWALEVSLWLAIVAYASGLAALARSRQMKLWLQIVFVILGVIVAEMPLQLLNGLETGLAVAAVTWALVLAATGRHSALAFLCGAMPFIRPELALFSLLLLARQSLKRFAEQEKAVALKDCGFDFLYAFAGAIPWLLLLFIDTGSLIPSTVAAKQFFFAETRLPSSTRLVQSAGAVNRFAMSIGVLSYFSVFLVADSIGVVGALTTIGIVTAYYMQFPGALNHYQQRYLYIVLPFLLYAASSVWSLAGTYARRAVALGLVLATVSSAWTAREDWQRHVKSCRSTVEQLDGVAQFCNTQLRPGSKLLIHDAGYISYATGFPLIDLVGLKTPQAVLLHKAITFPSAGRKRSDAIHQLALATHPDYIVVLERWDNVFHITEEMRQHGWQLQPLRPADSHPAYQVYRLQQPDSPAPDRAALSAESPSH